MKRFGLLGKKLSHSFSPNIHKKIFEILDVEASYDLFEVAEENILDFQRYMLENNIVGVNITIPYKKIFMDKLDFISEVAKKIGSINLMYVKDRKIYGDNTDYYGFYKTIIDNNIDVKDKKIYILGRGGASLSVRAVLEDLGAENITSLYRENKESKINFPENFSGDIIINTTPVGMYPNIEESIVPKELLKNFKIAIDLIYNPIETKFLKFAQENGLKTINGMRMLVEQAIRTDEILLNITFSDEMREKYENYGN